VNVRFAPLADLGFAQPGLVRAYSESASELLKFKPLEAERRFPSVQILASPVMAASARSQTTIRILSSGAQVFDRVATINNRISDVARSV
jgi:hypothetical protein